MLEWRVDNSPLCISSDSVSPSQKAPFLNTPSRSVHFKSPNCAFHQIQLSPDHSKSITRSRAPRRRAAPSCSLRDPAALSCELSTAASPLARHHYRKYSTQRTTVEVTCGAVWAEWCALVEVGIQKTHRHGGEEEEEEESPTLVAPCPCQN